MGQAKVKSSHGGTTESSGRGAARKYQTGLYSLFGLRPRDYGRG